MILLFCILIVIGILIVLIVFDKISTYYYVKSLSLPKLYEGLNECNTILKEMEAQEDIDVAYADKLLDAKDLYIHLINLKRKQLGITDEIHG